MGLMFVAFAVLAAFGPESPTKDDIVPPLQKGGFVVFIRHPQTHPDQADTDPLNLDKESMQAVGAW